MGSQKVYQFSFSIQWKWQTSKYLYTYNGLELFGHVLSLSDGTYISVLRDILLLPPSALFEIVGRREMYPSLC